MWVKRDAAVAFGTALITVVLLTTFTGRSRVSKGGGMEDLGCAEATTEIIMSNLELQKEAATAIAKLKAQHAVMVSSVTGSTGEVLPASPAATTPAAIIASPQTAASPSVTPPPSSPPTPPLTSPPNQAEDAEQQKILSDAQRERLKVTWPVCHGNTNALLCGGPHGGPGQCLGPEIVDTTMYHKHVPSEFRVKYVHNNGEKLDYKRAEDVCKAENMAVCSQDQLGGAWILGYENGCRGWVNDEFAKGIYQSGALHNFQDLTPANGGKRMTSQPAGEFLTPVTSLEVGLNSKFEGVQEAMGSYCCPTKKFDERSPRICEPQKGELSGSVLFGWYMRYFDLMQKHEGYPVLLGGSMIGALRNFSIVPECAESKHQSGIMFDEPDIDVVLPKDVFPAFDEKAFNTAWFADPLKKLLEVKKNPGDPAQGKDLPYRTHFIIQKHAGFIYPRITSKWSSLGRSVSCFIEEWLYKAYPARGGWCENNGGDGGTGSLCDKHFDPETLRLEDVSYDLLPGKAYLFKGAEAMLDVAFHKDEWRTKLDKKKYGAGQGKPRSWNAFSMNKEESAAFCKQVFPDVKEPLCKTCLK